MNALSMKCERGQSSQSTILHNAGYRFCRLGTLIALAVLTTTVICPVLRAQSGDTTAPDMSNVTDVTPGWKYLLRNDDLVMLQFSTSNGVTNTSLVGMNTSNSALSGTQQNIDVAKSNIPSSVDTKNSVLASEAAGRMFNTSTDAVGILYVFGSEWAFSVSNSAGVQASAKLNSSFTPNSTVFTQVVMGNFNGDGLVEPLAFYENTNFAGSEVQWGMMVVPAADPTKPWNFKEGPELSASTNTLTAPVAGTFVVGDFNGDGRDEIAALLNDYQTVAFYSVDPNTFAITQTATTELSATLTSGTFNIQMTTGQVALAAGKFRNCAADAVACAANGVTNDDLVVFGQISKIDTQGADFGYSVIPVKITAATGGPFTAAAVPMKNATKQQPFFRFPNYHGASAAIAHAAPIIYWPQQTNEQLVLGIKTENDASYIEIGSFLPDDGSFDTFDWESETERKYAASYDYLENMWVGNFDHTNNDASRTHNAGWQIETYEIVSEFFYAPHILIFNVNVPANFTPGSPRTDWLDQQSDNTGTKIPLQDVDGPPSLNFLVPADMQGRSLRLGSPTIVRILKQIQPSLVMSIPPMHVDWIKPYAIPSGEIPGCKDANTPCVLNVSVKPSVPPSAGAVGFATTFKFDETSIKSGKQSSTTSWGISTKISVGESSTFNDGLENASESIKDTTKTAHDDTVSKTYSHYSGSVQSLTATTGFSDFIFYTQRGMNVYYYPVLGCDANGTNCSKGATSTPPYVVFSVPDNITYNQVDSNTQDWYQPVHEPGNVLSYPWTEAQLQSRFTDTLKPLTTTATCMSNGSGTQTANTTWNQGEGTNRSSGSASSFSNELSMSYSEGAGVSGVDAADFNFSLDVAASTSLNTLNESTSSLSSSQGITITKPDFGYTSQCCTYGFGQYIFGLENSSHPASQNACQFGQTPAADGCLAVGSPDDGKPVVVGGVGPLFTGYIANPLGSHGTELTCSGNDSWWQNVYTAPDVALNHPERWNWDKNAQQATFNAAESPTKASPIDQQFYFMKGFYITKQSAGGVQGLKLPSSPNLAEASPDDTLTLTARVYDYSLKDTVVPVQVRFYGQLYCSGSQSSEGSCTDWRTGAACQAGNLCGDSFEIGQSQINPIPGFESSDGGDNPNWELASVDFAPSNFPATKNGKAEMVFWVVAWMNGANNEPAAEMPDHGLTAIPGPGLTQVYQVKTEAYSNNVGMYPIHQPFFLLPKGAPETAAPSSASLQHLSLSTNAQVQLGQRTKVIAAVESSGAPVRSVNIAYYDGDPGKNGKMFDVQTISYMDPGVSYYHRSFFTPDTCGVHNIYAKAWLKGSSGVQASTSTTVNLAPADFVQALINSTQAASVTDSQLRSSLLAQLNTALQDFQQGQTDAGNTALSGYMQQLALANGDGISTGTAGQLTGQAGVVLGCGSSGFSLVVAPSTVTVSAGSTASYALAVTPIGGFTGKVTFTCMGAPRGVGCTFSSPSVDLDGSSQSPVTITVDSNRSVSAAGFAGAPPSVFSAKIKWLLTLLLAALAIASLQRARLRQTILGCIIAMVVLGGVGGCGSDSSGGAALSSGTYPFTLQATSGTTVRNTLITLVVK